MSNTLLLGALGEVLKKFDFHCKTKTILRHIMHIYSFDENRGEPFRRKSIKENWENLYSEVPLSVLQWFCFQIVQSLVFNGNNWTNIESEFSSGFQFFLSYYADSKTVLKISKICKISFLPQATFFRGGCHRHLPD